MYGVRWEEEGMRGLIGMEAFVLSGEDWGLFVRMEWDRWNLGCGMGDVLGFCE